VRSILAQTLLLAGLLLDRPGEVWGAESTADRLVVVRRGG